MQPDVYRALLTLAYDKLPELDVCVLEDPEGHDYTNFLNRHFPDYNWAHQPDELLENMDGVWWFVCVVVCVCGGLCVWWFVCVVVCVCGGLCV